MASPVPPLPPPRRPGIPVRSLQSWEPDARLRQKIREASGVRDEYLDPQSPAREAPDAERPVS